MGPEEVLARLGSLGPVELKVIPGAGPSLALSLRAALVAARRAFSACSSGVGVRNGFNLENHDIPT
jgi:hypothetical protein